MNLSALAAASFAIQLHTAAACIAAVAGGVVLFRPKGTPAHRVWGWSFAAVIIVTTVSSFWIAEIRPGRYSWIHILSIVSLISVSAGLLARRRGAIRAHALSMSLPYIGLLIAGGFTFLPSRLMHDVFFGP